MSLLQMKHICKSFSGVYANEDINLTVEKGEIHALLGENGAGKSTTISAALGLVQVVLRLGLPYPSFPSRSCTRSF